jgi:sigma-E factor negative regulatory protein RseA
MNKDSKEHLSQLVDGEIGGDTGRFVLRQLEASSELRGAWTRYHLIRDCMRYQDRGFANDELSDRVRKAIDNTSASAGSEAASVQPNRRWLRPVTGFAVAAAVALMAVITVAPNLTGTTEFGTDQASATEAQPFASPNILSRGPESRQVNLNGDPQPGTQKMNSYLLRHYQVAGSSAGNGFVSFVPIVTSSSATPNVAEPEDQTQEQPEIESDPNQP